MKKRWNTVLLLSVCLLVPAAAHATTGVTYIGSNMDATDYSAAGLGIGQDGFLFFDWNLTADSGVDEDVDENAWINTLPAWLSVDAVEGSPTYSFGEDAGFHSYSRGGVSSWATLTLPDGSNGLSGALVDPRAADNSNNTIKSIVVGAGAPSNLVMHVVTDNTAGDHDPQNRIRAREDISDLDDRASDLVINGVPDVYSFRYDGLAPGDELKIQLNSGVAGEAPSIAGIMFDVVPEPSSLLLLSLSVLGLSLRPSRR